MTDSHLKKRTTFYFDSELHYKLKFLSLRKCVTMTKIVEEAILEYLDKEKDWFSTPYVLSDDD